MARVGVWLIGAQGSLASTVVLGARALARRLATGGGLVYLALLASAVEHGATCPC